MTDTRRATGDHPTPLTNEARRRGPVVAAVGGNSDGGAVLEAAHLVAAHLGADLTVFSAVEPPPLYSYRTEAALVPPGVIEREIASRVESTRALAARARAAAFDAPGAEWPVLVHYGEPAAAIAQVADDLDARLVVMGIGRHKPINRLLATETTLSTMRRVRCPVLAVSGEMRALPRTVVAATDFAAASIHAAASALPLLADDATVFLVHAWSRHEPASPAREEADDAYERSLGGKFDRLRAALRAPASLTLKSVELVGEPVGEVVDFARGHRADLIVAGTRGRGFFERLIVGSVATALLRGATRSVLVVPEPPAAERTRLEQLMAERPTSRFAAEWRSALEGLARRERPAAPD